MKQTYEVVKTYLMRAPTYCRERSKGKDMMGLK